MKFALYATMHGDIRISLAKTQREIDSDTVPISLYGIASDESMSRDIKCTGSVLIMNPWEHANWTIVSQRRPHFDMHILISA